MRAASQRHCSCHWQPAGPARRRQFIALYIWILGIWPRLAAVTSRVKQSTQMGGASSTASAGANATAVPLYAQRLMRKPGMRGDLIVDPAFKLNLIATHHGQQVPAAKYDAIRRDFMQFALEVRGGGIRHPPLSRSFHS